MLKITSSILTQFNSLTFAPQYNFSIRPKPRKILKPKSTRYKTIQPSGLSRPYAFKTNDQIIGLLKEWAKSEKSSAKRVTAIAKRLKLTFY